MTDLTCEPVERTAKPRYRTSGCFECGAAIAPKRIKDARRAGQAPSYCSTACRKAFNNRRAMQGAELLDAFARMRVTRDPEERRYAYWLLDEMLRDDWRAGRDRLPKVRRRVRGVRMSVGPSGRFVSEQARKVGA